MLFAQALLRTIELWESTTDDFVVLSLKEYVRDHVPLITLQILVRTLSAQHENGSWHDCAETTAYGLLTLKRVANLPWCTSDVIKENIRGSIDRGQKFLRRWDEVPPMIWVEKVTYGSAILSKAYCLASLVAKRDISTSASNALASKLSGLLDTILPTGKKLSSFVHFLSRLPILSTEPLWRLHASVVEGYLLGPQLEQCLSGLKIFCDTDSSAMGKEKKHYLEYIPLTWTACNNAAGFGISTQTLSDMMCISALNFQIDKYLEQVTDDGRVLSNGALGFKAIRKAIRGICQDAKLGHSLHLYEALSPEFTSLLQGVDECLSRFKDFITEHPRISRAPPVARRRLLRQLSIFLQAHISHGEHNAQRRNRMALTRNDRVFVAARERGDTYYDWVRTTSADHTSCPYSFEFFTCLISAPRNDGNGIEDRSQAEDCFSHTSLIRYLASDVCRHLATLCRQYNDYGSVRRDCAEENLNSIDFPEFHRELGNSSDVDPVALNRELLNSGSATENGLYEQTLMKDRSAQLMEVAAYERECLDLASRRLKLLIDARTARALQVFINVTDLYGQIYVVRDINSGS